MGVQHNQILMDGNQKALTEIELLVDATPLLLPNPSINLPTILSKSIEGYNLEMYNREKNRVRTSMQKDVGDNMYSIAMKKTKIRVNSAKKFQNFLNRIQGVDEKPEYKLRLLRNLRIKLLHTYCRETLREAY